MGGPRDPPKLIRMGSLNKLPKSDRSFSITAELDEPKQKVLGYVAGECCLLLGAWLRS